jgi:hypothetical protein
VMRQGGVRLRQAASVTSHAAPILHHAFCCFTTHRQRRRHVSLADLAAGYFCTRMQPHGAVLSLRHPASSSAQSSGPAVLCETLRMHHRHMLPKSHTSLPLSTSPDVAGPLASPDAVYSDTHKGKHARKGAGDQPNRLHSPKLPLRCSPGM